MATLFNASKRTLLAVLLTLVLSAPAWAATLLPPGKQVFLDANGAPLASGSVTFYVPGTSTPKDTYQDAAASILNTNPVLLDAAGSAVIFGSGAYREIVKDVNGNTIWDKYTSDTSASTSSWGAISAGSANAQTVAAPNFTSQDGQAIEFVAGFTNTGPMTLNGVPVKVDASTGPGSLTGGEIVAGNAYRVVYASTAGILHLTSTSILRAQIVNTTGVATFGGLVTASAGLTGTTLNSTGNTTVGGALGVTGGSTLTGALAANGGVSTTTLAASGTISSSTGFSGPTISTANSSALGGVTFLGGATADAFYATINGSILTPAGGAVRATNTVSMRFSIASGGVTNSFNTGTVTRTGTGVYTVAISNALLNNSYQVTGNCVPGSTALLCPVATSKTTTGFTLNFYNSSTGAVADLAASPTSDIVVTGGN